MGLAKNLDIYVYATKKGKMDMDELIFEMGQPNEIITTPEWTEWWAVDETGLHLEYAAGYEPEQYYEYSESMWDDEYATTQSLVIDVDDLPLSRFQHIADRWEEVFGKLEDTTESTIDTQVEHEPTYYPYPITEMGDHEHYLDYLRDAIDQYNGWYNENPKFKEGLDETREDSEETVVEWNNTDGLILPTPRL